jgi:hypothetical protein
MSPREVQAYVSLKTGKIYKTASEAAKEENTLDKKKFAALKKRIKDGKYWLPKVGEYIYSRTSLSIDHGETDVVGGLATVTKVTYGMSGGDPKTPFIEIAQHEQGGWNWRVLWEDQQELMDEYGKDWAYADPDYVSGYDPHEWQ